MPVPKSELILNGSYLFVNDFLEWVAYLEFIGL